MRHIEPYRLRFFVAESNRIEGLATTTSQEVEAHEDFLRLEVPTVGGLETLVSVLAPGHRLRREVGYNVRVDTHIAPPGGPDIEPELNNLLDRIAKGYLTAFSAHCQYETLHPFTNGNGRSGRALWLWQMIRPPYNYDLSLKFLHMFYYQALRDYRNG